MNKGSFVFVHWQTEGANLYDVFQRISKGDFAPLPAERFSAKLGQLVSSLLSMDPSSRPDIEDVCKTAAAAAAATPEKVQVGSCKH